MQDMYVLQCVAACCSLLQCVRIEQCVTLSVYTAILLQHCNILMRHMHHGTIEKIINATQASYSLCLSFSIYLCLTCARYSVLQCVAVCCTVFGSIASYICRFQLQHMIFCDPYFMLIKLYSSNLYIQKYVYTNLV